MANSLDQIEERLRKERPRRRRTMKVSGKQVAQLKQVIAKRARRKKSGKF